VKAIIRTLCVAFAMMGMLSVTGCGPDNESEGMQAGKKLGDAGKAAEGSTTDKTFPVTSLDNAGRKAPTGGSQAAFQKKMEPAPAPAKK
jgi:hypothetical protein